MENRPRKPPRQSHEDHMLQKRDREQRHAETWSNQAQYYDRMERNNSRYDNWTSPRYYETNNHLIQQVQDAKTKSERLEKRRERLRKLLMEDEESWGIELVRLQRDVYVAKKKNEADIEVLRSVRDEIKSGEEMRRKAEAEKGLYKQWRSQQPVLRDCLREKNTKDLKLSWLDQQIEKRMAKEKEAENLKKFLNEREEQMKMMKIEDEGVKEELHRKQEQLKEGLDKQIREIKVKEEEGRRLKFEEEARIGDLLKFDELKSLRDSEERRRKDRECDLFNLKEYRRKLEARSKDIAKEIEADLRLIQEVQAKELAEKFEEETKKMELKESMQVFSELLAQLKDLEEKRKPHLDFVFESEAKSVYDSFEKSWAKEQQMRNDLFHEVFTGIRQQLEENVVKNKERQKKLVEEKESILALIQSDNEELKLLKEIEAQKEEKFKKELDEQVKENCARRRKLDGLEKRSADEELERIKNEEEKLKREISRIQLGKSCPTYGRRRFFY